MLPEINENLQLDIDHLHPQSAFNKAELARHGFLKNDPGFMAFYRNPVNWNSIANLHLLNASQNHSKKGMPLIEWLAEKGCGVKPADLLLHETDSLQLEALLQRLRCNVVVTGAALVSDDELDEEEETKVAA